MSLVAQLVGFGLRQVIGDFADNAVQVVDAVEKRFRDHSRTLPKALDQAHNRAWQALGVALAGDGLLDRVKVFFASGDDKGVREQVQIFLNSNAVSFNGTPADFRRDCLDELKRLRKSGLLSTQGGSSAEIARQAAGFRRHADPQGLVEESRRAVAGVADALAEGYPNLARLLRTPTPAGPPLLAAAFGYFFRREVETDGELAHGLFFDGLRQLSASQAKAFGEVGKALAALGGQFDAVFEQLGRIETAVVETHGAVLDLQAALQRLGGLHLANAAEVRTQMEQVLSHLAQAGMARGEVRPGNSCSIRGEDERRAVKALLARFRRLPAEEQRQAPALLNGLGKLQVGAGDFAEARQTFTEVVQVVGDPTDKAEASFNAYRAALEEKQWDYALAALRVAASHDPQRFAPFPLDKYEPLRILGAGGFGVAFLCQHKYTNARVVVKALRDDVQHRDVERLYSEAELLQRVDHPAVIRLHDCAYANPAARDRPYLVMDYFDGVTLEQYIAAQRVLAPEELPCLARPLAEALQAAHSQGVLHRDVKPANVLLRRDGAHWQVRLIDFGLALRHEPEVNAAAQDEAQSLLGKSVAGTIDYASPEQMGQLPGIKPGFRSDVYGLGKTCLYALFQTVRPRHKQWEELSKPLAELLNACVADSPDDRPQDFEAVLAGLQPVDCLAAAEVRRLKGHSGLVKTLAFFPDGRRLLSGGEDKTIRAWDVSTGKEVVRIDASAEIYEIAALPCGRRVLAGGAKRELRLWDLETKEEVHQFIGHGGMFGGDAVFAVAVSPDGRFAVSGGADGSIRVWQLGDEHGLQRVRKEIRRFTGHTGPVLSVTFSQDGGHVLSSGGDSMRLWDATSGKHLLHLQARSLVCELAQRLFRLPSPAPRSGVFRVAFVLGGHAVSAGSDNAIRIWDLQAGKEIRRLNVFDDSPFPFLGQPGGVASIATTAHGVRAISATADGWILLWSIGTGKWSWLGHSRGAASCLAMSADGRLAASASGETIHLWELPDESRT